MIVYSRETFFKSLSQPGHHLFLAIFAGDERDAKHLAKETLASLAQKHPGLEAVYMTGGDSAVDGWISEWTAEDLFAPHRCFVLSGLDSLSATSVEKILTSLSHCSSSTYFLILSEGRVEKQKKFSSEATKGLILDLRKEKPWDKQKRLCEEMVFFAKEQKRKLTIEEAMKWLQVIGLDIFRLESEIFRYTLLYPDHREIKAPLSFFATQKEYKAWQIVDQILFGEAHFVAPDMEGYELVSLFSQLKSRLHLAIAVKEKNDEAMKKWMISESMLAKQKPLIDAYPLTYYLRALQTVYEGERLSRTAPLKGSQLLSLAYCKCKEERERCLKKS